MKKNLQTLIILLFLSNISNAKGSENCFNVFEKYEEATIHFLDGTSIKGYGKIVDFLKIYKIKFKASSKGKPEVWTHLMVKGMTIHREYEDFIFHYVKIYQIGNPVLLQVVELGVVSLYIEVNKHWVISGFDSKTGSPINPGYLETSYRYLIKKEEDLIAFDLNRVIGFKKKIKNYFGDCAGIIHKLNKKEFNKNTIPEMVYYYNDFCAD